MSSFSRRDFLSMAAGGAAVSLAGGFDNTVKAMAAQNKPSDINPKPMNILLIVAEDMGLQLGCYGDKTVPTPNLDNLASDGVLFNNAFTTHASCSPARSSIFTGLYPHQNGQVGLSDCGYSMYKGIPTLPGLLKNCGYRTGITYKIHVQSEEDLPFDVYYDWYSFNNLGTHVRDVKQMAKFCGEFIGGCDDKPFFLMANFNDTHTPFEDQHRGVPEKPVKPEDVEIPGFFGKELDIPEVREVVAGYYNSIQRIDFGVGLLMELLERKGCADNTLVIFLADHGPAFTRGKLSCYELGLHIPFMVRWPGKAKKGLVSDELVSVVDILPTSLEAAGVAVPKHIAGRSLRKLAEGSEVNWRGYVCCEYTTHGPKDDYYPRRTIRDKRYKLILNLLPERENPRGGPDSCNIYRIAMSKPELDGTHTRAVYQRYHMPPAAELYDLQKDPNEFYNLAGKAEYKKIEDTLAGQLQLWRVQTDDPLLDAKTLQVLTEMHDKAGERIEQEAEGIDWPERWKYYKIDMSRFQKDWR